MSKMVWDVIGEREFETGVDHGVLFPMSGNAYTKGVAWSGLSSVNESPSGGESTPVYADNIKYLDMMSNEEFGGTIEAYMYPDEFAACDGSAEASDGLYLEQQTRKSFGFSYRTLVGNDTEGTDYGYKLHIIYNAKANPSEKSRSTVNDSPEATTLSWEFKTTPVVLNTINPETNKPYKATSHIVIKSTRANAAKLAELEDILYGTETTDPRLPLPDEILSLFAEDPNPLTNLRVDADIAAGTDLHGKVVSDLQSGIVVGSNAITGTLKYVSDYTGYSEDPEDQKGNYIALHMAVPGEEDVSISCGIGTTSAVGSDGIAVLIVKSLATPITVTASKAGYDSVTKTFNISNLVLESE